MADLNDPKNEPTLLSTAYETAARTVDQAYQNLPSADTVKSYVPGLAGASATGAQSGGAADNGSAGESKADGGEQKDQGASGGDDAQKPASSGQENGEAAEGYDGDKLTPHQSLAHSKTASATSPDESTLGKRKVPGPKSKEQIDKEVKSLGQDPAAAEGQAASGGEAAEAAKAGGEGEGEETLNGEGAGNGAATEGEETKGAEDTGAKKSSWKSKIKKLFCLGG